MFKKKLVALSAIMIAGLMTFQANVSADAVEEKPYLSLGADLSASQKSKVLELLGVKENEDGTVTLTVDAVCDMVICDDAVITHELTVKFADDGSFQYLGNEILNDGIMHIPDYQYRIRE